MRKRGWSHLDESDVRVRPGRGSRPRSKKRPKHADAEPAMVVAVDRGRWRCALDGDPDRIVTAMRARELGRTPVVVGDRVKLVGDTSGKPDTLARIVRVEERTSVLRRTADDTDPYERVVVANAEQLVIVSALADPPPRPGFIDRCLVAAYAGGLSPVLCLTKADLAEPGEWLDTYASLDMPIHITRFDEDPAELRELLDGRVSALVGHSGVGKSTLVNRLVPTADRATGEVSGVGKGRHISTSAVALPLPGEGWVVDTPGIRSFGLAHVTPDDVIAAFEGFAEAAEECPPNCGHLGG
ncbi:ribosome small subunit-dependent GTPase A [Saccharopolyspora hordei]